MDYQEENLEQVRQKARLLATRVGMDARLREQIRRDPVKTLVAAGLPEFAVADFLRITELADVSGYMGCSGLSAF